jgi:hypothetical protein
MFTTVRVAIGGHAPEQRSAGGHFDGRIGDSGEAERLFRTEVERHSGMIPNTIGW